MGFNRTHFPLAKAKQPDDIYFLQCQLRYPFCAKMLNSTAATISPPAVRSVDPDQFRDFASNAVLAADRLSADELPSRLRQIQLGDWAMDLAEVNNHLKVDGILDADRLAVVVVQRGADSSICGVPLKEDRVLVLPGGSRLVANARPGLRYHATTLSSAMWEDISTSVLDTDFETIGKDIQAFDLGRLGAAVLGSAAAASSRLLDLARDSTTPEALPDALADHIGALLQLCMPMRGVCLDRSLKHRMQQAWQAQDFIHAHLHEQISMPLLCRELRISRRQLEYAFRTAFEVAPKEFIQLMRLNEGRRRLMTARRRGLSVTDVAMDVGVNHLGRFSTSYRELFGETPRATLLAGG